MKKLLFCLFAICLSVSSFAFVPSHGMGKSKAVDVEKWVSPFKCSFDTYLLDYSVSVVHTTAYYVQIYVLFHDPVPERYFASFSILGDFDGVVEYREFTVYIPFAQQSKTASFFISTTQQPTVYMVDPIDYGPY